jgi:acetylornithine/succinyldiaminopimelate/putrescine aminotransferase
LAGKLNGLIAGETKKNFRVQFGNSGTEAVEIALHHASLEWRKKIEKARMNSYNYLAPLQKLM